MTESHYQVIVKFHPNKGDNLDPVFYFWINEDRKLHRIIIVKMLEAAAQERWNIPIVSKTWTGEDFLSLVADFKVIRIE